MTVPGYSKRLRAVTQDTPLQFADTMDRQGHAKQIVDGIDDEFDPRSYLCRFCDQNTLVRCRNLCGVLGDANCLGHLIHRSLANCFTTKQTMDRPCDVLQGTASRRHGGDVEPRS